MEYLRNLPFQTDFSYKELSDALRSIQLEIISENNDNQRKKNYFFAELYNVISMPPDQIKMKQSRWNEICINILSFIAIMLPDFSYLPNLRIDTQSPELLFLTTFLSPNYLSFFNLASPRRLEENRTSQIAIPFPKNYYSDEKYLSTIIDITHQLFQRIINEKTTMSQFYTRNLYYFSLFLPRLLYSVKKDFVTDSQYSEFFRQIAQLGNKISDDFHEQSYGEIDPEIKKIILPYSAYEAVFNYIKISKTANEAQKQFFRSLFADLSISSYLISYIYLDNGWRESKELRDSFFLVFYQSSRERVTDVFNQFKFFLLLKLYEQAYQFYLSIQSQNKSLLMQIKDKQPIVQLTHFLCQVFNGNFRNITINPQIDLQKKIDNFNNFWSNISILAKEKQFSWPLFCMFEKLISTFNHITYRMNFVKGFKLKNGIDETLKREHIISFYDQNLKSHEMRNDKVNSPKRNNSFDDYYTSKNYFHNLSKDLDRLLFTAYECRYYNNYEEAHRGYESSLEIFEIAKRTQLLLDCMKFLNFHVFINEHTFPKSIQSYIQFYTDKYFKSFFNFMIFSSYSSILLNSMALIHPPPDHVGISKKPPDFSLLFTRLISDLVSRIKGNVQLIDLIVSALADCLYTATKKQVVTQHCIKLIIDMVSSNSMHDKFIQRMMAIGFNNIQAIDESDANQMCFFQQWIFLTIKIGDSQISHTLRNYQRSFIHQFLMKSNRVLQPEILVLLIKYIDAMRTNASQYQLAQFQSKDSRTLFKSQRFLLMHEIQSEYERELSLLFIDPIVLERQFTTQTSQNAFNALSFPNPSMYRQIIETLKELLNYSDFYIESNDDKYNEQFQQLLISIRNLPYDSSFDFLDIVPKFGPMFITYQNQFKATRSGYKFIVNESEGDISKIGIEISSVLENIQKQSSRTEIEAKHTLLFISHFVQTEQVLHFTLNDLKLLLNLLFTLARFNSIQNHVLSIINQMNTLFHPLIQDQKKYDYIFAFMLAVSFTSSKSSQFGIESFKSFINGLNVTIGNASRIIDAMFDRIQHPYPFFNILFLFTFLVKRKPGCITINHFISLFAFLKESNCNILILKDSTFFSFTLNKFLKSFIQSLNTDQKNQCFKYMYQLIKKQGIPNQLKPLLVKRLPDLKKQFNIPDLSFIKNSTPDSFFYHLSIILGCGMKDKEITQEMVDQSIFALGQPEPKQQQFGLPNLYSRFAFLQMLRKANIDVSLFLQKDKLERYLSFAHTTYAGLPSKPLDKIIKWILTVKPELNLNPFRSIQDSIPPETLMSDEKRFKSFKQSLISMHNYIKTEHLITVLKYITLASKNMNLALYFNVCDFLKFLSMINFTDNNNTDIRNAVLYQTDGETTFLAQFIHDIALIFQQPSFQYGDLLEYYVLKFLSNFKKDSIYIIIKHPYASDTRIVYDILYKLLLKYNDEEMINSFIKIFDPSSKMFPLLHPYVYDIEYKLSKLDKFVQYERFRELVTIQFNHFFNRRQDIIITDNDQNQLNTIVKCYINVEKVIPSSSGLCDLAAFFASSSNVYTSLYLKFKSEIFYNRKADFYISLLSEILDHCYIDEGTTQLLPIDKQNMYPHCNILSNESIKSSNYKLYHNITNSATAILLSNLIKNIFTNSIDIGELYEKLIATLSLMVEDRDQRYCAFKCLYTLYKFYPKDKLNLLSEIMTKVQFHFKIFLEQPESYPIILTYKFAARLLQYDMLINNPKFPIISHLLTHIFTFPKFFDYPYNISVCKFMKLANSYFNKDPSAISNELLTSFQLFLLTSFEKLYNRNEMEKLYTSIQFLTSLVKKLPFSTFAALLHRFDIYAKTNNQISNLLIQGNVIMKLSNYYDKFPDEIEKQLDVISCNLICSIIKFLEEPGKKQTRYDSILTYCIKRLTFIPEQLIQFIASKVNSHNQQVSRIAQNILILTMEKADENLLISYREIILTAVESDLTSKLGLDMKVYINSIFTRSKLEDCFGKNFINYFNQLLETKERAAFEYLFQLLYFYVKTPQSTQKFELLEKFLNASRFYLSMSHFWLNKYFSFIGDLPPCQQEAFLDLILENINKQENEFQFVIGQLIEFFRSKKINNPIKQKFLYKLPAYISTLKYEALESLYEVIKELPSSFSCFELTVTCDLLMIMKSNDESRLLHLERFSKHLGDNEVQRFLKFNSKFCQFLWSNDSLLFTVLAISDDTPLSKPLAMISDCLEFISSKFAVSLFMRIMNEQTIDAFHHLLRNIFSLKQSDRFKQVISAIIVTYYQLELGNQIQLSMLYKAIKVSDNDYLYENGLNNLNNVDTMPEKLLLPHQANDMIFSMFPKDTNIDVLAASAQFFLSNYEAAAKVFSVTDISTYQKEPSSPEFNIETDSSLANLSIYNEDATLTIPGILEPMNRIADDFFQKKRSVHIFERYDHENDSSITKILDDILKPGKLNDNEKIAYIKTAWNINLNYLKNHKNPTYFDLQRLLAIDTTLMIFKQQILPPPTPIEQPNINPKQPSKHLLIPHIVYPPTLLNALFNSYYSSLINDLQNHLYHNDIIRKDPLTINISSTSNVGGGLNDNPIIFSHEYRNVFKSISDENSYGFFSLPISSIETSAANLISEMSKITAANSNMSINIPVTPYKSDEIQKNAHSDMFKKELTEMAWPGFCFTLLTMNSVLSPTLYQAALYGYINLARKSSATLFMHQSYIARIITLLHILASNENDQLIEITKRICKDYLKDKSLFRYFKLWAPQVVNLQSRKWFGELIGNSANQYLSFYSTLLSHDTSMKYPLPIVSYFRHLHLLMNTIFSIDSSLFDYNDDIDSNSSNRYLTYNDINDDLDPSIRDQIDQYLFELNRELPIDFDLPLHLNLLMKRVQLYRIHSDFIKLSDNLIAFTAATITSPRQLFIVERTRSTDHIVTFSNVLFLFQQMMKFGYSTRLKNIRLSASFAIELENDMVLYTFPCGSNRLSSFEFTDQPVPSINADSDLFFMKKVLINPSIYTPQSYFDQRRLLLANYAGYSAIRSIFGLNKPNKDDLYLSFESAEVPLFASDFSIPTELTKTATLLTPELESLFILNPERQFILNFAAVHQILVSYIDAFRSIVEIPIHDSLDVGQRSIDDILSKRDFLDASLLEYAPPFSERANVSDSIEWYKRLCEYVENSKDESFDKCVLDHPELVSISSSLVANTAFHDFSMSSNPTEIKPNSSNIAPLASMDSETFGMNLFDMSNSSGLGMGTNDSIMDVNISAQPSVGFFGNPNFSFDGGTQQMPQAQPFLATNSADNMTRIQSPAQPTNNAQLSRQTSSTMDFGDDDDPFTLW